jgi:hypothetical protein
MLRQVEIRLVEQGRRAERQLPAAARQLRLGEPVELGVEGREEGVGRFAIAPLDGGDQR